MNENISGLHSAYVVEYKTKTNTLGTMDIISGKIIAVINHQGLNKNLTREKINDLRSINSFTIIKTNIAIASEATQAFREYRYPVNAYVRDGETAVRKVSIGYVVLRFLPEEIFESFRSTEYLVLFITFVAIIVMSALVMMLEKTNTPPCAYNSGSGTYVDNRPINEGV